jgi:hypothetical protein
VKAETFLKNPQKAASMEAETGWDYENRKRQKNEAYNKSGQSRLDPPANHGCIKTD